MSLIEYKLQKYAEICYCEELGLIVLNQRNFITHHILKTQLHSLKFLTQAFNLEELYLRLSEETGWLYPALFMTFFWR